MLFSAETLIFSCSLVLLNIKERTPKLSARKQKKAPKLSFSLSAKVFTKEKPKALKEPSVSLSQIASSKGI
jgi:hypothetical protein